MAKPVDVFLAPFVVHLVLLVLYFDIVRSDLSHKLSSPPVPSNHSGIGPTALATSKGDPGRTALPCVSGTWREREPR